MNRNPFMRTPEEIKRDRLVALARSRQQIQKSLFYLRQSRSRGALTKSTQRFYIYGMLQQRVLRDEVAKLHRRNS